MSALNRERTVVYFLTFVLNYFVNGFAMSILSSRFGIKKVVLFEAFSLRDFVLDFAIYAAGLTIIYFFVVRCIRISGLGKPRHR